VLNITFPYNLTNPETVPTFDPDPVLFPVAQANLTNASSEAVVAAAMAEILGILDTTNTGAYSGLANNCSRCIAALSVGQMVAKLAPTYLPNAMIDLCQKTGWSSNSTCKNTYEASSFGAAWTQILAHADVTGLDGRYICSSLSSTFCTQPPVVPVKAKFPKPKPTNPKQPSRSGKLVKAFHLSDLHLGKKSLRANLGPCVLMHPRLQIPDIR
jgi:hypothetical protein